VPCIVNELSSNVELHDVAPYVSVFVTLGNLVILPALISLAVSKFPLPDFKTWLSDSHTVTPFY